MNAGIESPSGEDWRTGRQGFPRDEGILESSGRDFARSETGSAPWDRVLYTGDLFKMDEEGFLYFVARKDEMIKVSGFLVSPKEIENALTEIPGVREAAVMGVEDRITARRQGLRGFEGRLQAQAGRYPEVKRPLPGELYGPEAGGNQEKPAQEYPWQDLEEGSILGCLEKGERTDVPEHEPVED